jgi:hypothetical protein
LTDLSENARFVLGHWFGPCKAMIYEMVDCVPSPEMQAALDELVQAGHIIRDNPYAAAVRYTRVDDDMWRTCQSDVSLGWVRADFPDHIPA